MKTYRIKLKFESGILTPLYSDTIFGHLCWTAAYRDGVQGLKDFLKPYMDGNPPFVISDGFPGDYLPKPISIELKAKDDFKEIKKINWLKLAEFNRIRCGELFLPAKENDITKIYTTTHNTIDRKTNTVVNEGGVYSIKETFVSEVSVYLKVVSDEWKNKVEELFGDLSKMGYGRKKSLGKGQFNVQSVEEFNFEEIPGANGFVTLSNFCPAENDTTDGLYKTFVKYGKLGEEFTFCGKPFKKPLLMMKTGSVFKTGEKPRDYYGRMIDKIAPAKESEVLQYAYAFAVPIRYPF